MREVSKLVDARWGAATLALAAAALAAGCFAPNYGHGEVACGPPPESACPPGYECGLADRRCYRSGTAPDAAPDAAPPDAALPDAAAPRGTQVVFTSGGGPTGATQVPGSSRAVISMGQPISGTTGAAGASVTAETGILPQVKVR